MSIRKSPRNICAYAETVHRASFTYFGSGYAKQFLGRRGDGEVYKIMDMYATEQKGRAQKSLACKMGVRYPTDQIS